MSPTTCSLANKNMCLLGFVMAGYGIARYLKTRCICEVWLVGYVWLIFGSRFCGQLTNNKLILVLCLL